MGLEKTMNRDELIKMYLYYESEEEAKVKLADCIADKNIEAYLKYLKYEQGVKQLDVAEKYLEYARQDVEKSGYMVEVINCFIRRFKNYTELRRKYKEEKDKKEKEKMERELKNRNLWEI